MRREKAINMMLHVPQMTLALALTMICATSGTCLGGTVRIKDITTIEGERFNYIAGPGLVAGLAGTGGKTIFTREFISNVLTRFGNRVDPTLRPLIGTNAQLKTNNLSAVWVSARLPVTARPGEQIDVAVAAIDDASSLRGGRLIIAALNGLDGQVYALAQGPVSLGGGFSFSGDAASVVESHPTSGYVPKGGIVELETPIDYHDPTHVRLLLNPAHADWATASRITAAINQAYPGQATTESSNSISVCTPSAPEARALFIAGLQSLTVAPDVVARVIINERTGTVIMGRDVKLSPNLAITHGNLSVITGETPQVSQPLPFSDGETTVVPRTEIDVLEEKNPIVMLNESASVADLADGLNTLGVSPGDLAAIFQALQQSGHLHATVIFE